MVWKRGNALIGAGNVWLVPKAGFEPARPKIAKARTFIGLHWKQDRNDRRGDFV
jgi:hypothetical protein